ncbi:MAG: rod shape-determining protein [Planctomycetota bacterium]|nr:MAG: rod shape-determining protein [Planctomycetota bacterium]
MVTSHEGRGEPGAAARRDGEGATAAGGAEREGFAGSVTEAVERLKQLHGREQRGVLYVGIDLGTSRTAVATSTGIRCSVSSFVGYPRDMVARKALQRDVLFGDEALRHRLSVDLYRPLEHGVIKYSDGPGGASPLEVERNMQAAKDLIKHAVSLARPRGDELIYGVIGCPAQASIRNKQCIIEAAREVLDSVVICSEPFAVAYGLDILEDALVIDIGAGTVDLCRMKGAMPDETDQITNRFAGDFIDRELYRRLRERLPDAQFTIHQIKALKERYAFVTEHAEPVFATFPVRGKPRRFDVTEELRTACRSIIPPMIEGIEQLIGTFDPEFQERLRHNVVLGGGGSQIRGLGDYLEEALAEYGGARVRMVEEPVYAGANGALAIARDMPEDTWEELR